MKKIQQFEVIPPVAHVVLVTVIQAHPHMKKSATKMGSLHHVAQLTENESEFCVVLRIDGVSEDDENGVKKTRRIRNQIDPNWNETFEFYIDATKTNILEIILVETNYLTLEANDSIATGTYNLNDTPLNLPISVTLSLNSETEVDLKFLRSIDETPPGLRFSTELCKEEILFLHKRRQRVYEGLKKLLGENSPKTLEEVPTIAILSSGGGFRAVVGLCGIVNALHKTGILDCITYFAGLSGSAWYLATLYSHPEFPNIQISNDIKSSIGQSPFSLLRPQSLYKYIEEIIEKQQIGQFVSFTDLFALMLRDTLLKNNPKGKLSDQRFNIEEAMAPLPLYAAIHVKRNVQARVYHEWMEFSPYEVGISKYGTFMRIEHFGSMFHLGRLRKQFPEFPLCYLLGMWGSAFSVLFRQLLWINETDKRLSKMSEALDAWQENMEFSTTEEDTKKDEAFRYNFTTRNVPMMDKQEHQNHWSFINSKSLYNVFNLEIKNLSPLLSSAKSSLNLNRLQRIPLDFIHSVRKATETHQQSKEKTGKVQQILQAFMDALYTSEALNSIYGRAALIHNPFYGLHFRSIFEEEKIVFTNRNDDETFKGFYEPLSTTESYTYIVDGGLAFNSPYPVLLRPERRVQLYLSFDFSTRLKDNALPFKDLILSAEWARKSGLPFPPVEEIIAEKYQNQPVREYYVFQHPSDPECPVIIHFVLINNKFRHYKEPGVLRASAEEKNFADFTIFEDASNPFSIFNFCYTSERFDQMSALMEFNTMLGADTIKHVITKIINPQETVDYEPDTSSVRIHSFQYIFNRLSTLIWRVFRRLFFRNRVSAS